MNAIDQAQPHSQRAEISWTEDGTPVSDRFDDPYYSLSDGLAEAQYVFLNGNDLQARIADGFSIAELGFGTGLNLLAVAMASGAEHRINYTSFEAFPMDADSVTRSLSLASELSPGNEFIAAIAKAMGDLDGQFQLGEISVNVIFGDARQELANWNGLADAWFLDGFSPAKNPEMWEPELLSEVGKHTVTDGSFATFTAAGAVRRELEHAGFAVERVPGFGRKRHMTRGKYLGST